MTGDDPIRFVAARLLEQAKDAEPDVTALLLELQNELGGDINPTFERNDEFHRALESRLKSLESLTRKLRQLIALGFGLDEAEENLFDALRYTFVLDDSRYVDLAREITDRLIADGYHAIRARNYWDLADGYAGVNTIWMTPNGQLFELQFHTRRSFLAKETTHVIYERQRLLPKGSDAYRIAELETKEEWKKIRRDAPDVEALNELLLSRFLAVD